MVENEKGCVTVPPEGLKDIDLFDYGKIKDALKRIDLFKSQLFTVEQAEKEAIKNYYEESGLKSVLEYTKEKLEGTAFKGLFLENISIPSTLETNKLSDFIIVNEKDDSWINHEQISKNFALHTIFRKHKLGLLYQQNFWKYNDKGVCYLTKLQLENDTYKDFENKIKEIKSKEKFNFKLENVMKELKSKGEFKEKEYKFHEVKIEDMKNEEVYVQNVTLPKFTYERIFGELEKQVDKDLKKYFYLHHLAYNYYFTEKKDGKRNRVTYLLSMPILAAYAGEEYNQKYNKGKKGTFNGQGVCFVFLEFEENEENEEKELEKLLESYAKGLHKLIKDIVFNFSFYSGIKLFHRSLNYAIRSSIAAIMARNGSHNIGSHVISSVTKADNDLFEDQYFMDYLKQRFDFLASITTRMPRWSSSVWFCSNLMRYFYLQQHLLNYIANAEKLRAYEFQKDAKQKDKILIKVSIKKEGKEKETIIEENKNDRKKLQHDIMCAMPGGVIGYQAFYTIVENILRNSAKYGWSRRRDKWEEYNSKKNTSFDPPKNLEIDIYIEELADRNIVTISDNVSIASIKKESDSENIYKDLYVVKKEAMKKNEEIHEPEEMDRLSKDDKFNKLPLHVQQNHRLMQSFIDLSTGELKKEDWGLAEMKICAGFLNMRSYKEIAENGTKVLFHKDSFPNGIISALKVRKKINENDDEEYPFLGYQFPIKKPKEVLITGNPWNCGEIEEEMLSLNNS